MISALLLLLVAQQAEPPPLPAEIETPGLARTSQADAGSTADDPARSDAGVDVPAPHVVAPSAYAELGLVAKRTPQTFLTVHGIGGVGAGFILIPVPAPYAGPWAGFGVRLERRVLRASFLEFGLDLSAGSSESGRPIGGYQLLATFGTRWVDTRFFIIETKLRAGIVSAVLVPLPQLGGMGSFYLQPLRSDVIRWRLGMDVALDFILLLPAVSSALSSDVRFNVGAGYFGLKVGAGSTLGVTTGFGVAASAKLYVGAGF